MQPSQSISLTTYLLEETFQKVVSPHKVKQVLKCSHFLKRLPLQLRHIQLIMSALCSDSAGEPDA